MFEKLTVILATVLVIAIGYAIYSFRIDLLDLVSDKTQIEVLEGRIKESIRLRAKLTLVESEVDFREIISYEANPNSKVLLLWSARYELYYDLDELIDSDQFKITIHRDRTLTGEIPPPRIEINPLPESVMTGTLETSLWVLDNQFRAQVKSDYLKYHQAAVEKFKEDHKLSISNLNYAALKKMEDIIRKITESAGIELKSIRLKMI